MKKKYIFIIVVVFLIVLGILFWRPAIRPLVPVKYSESEILNYLHEKYNEDFGLKDNFPSSDNKNSVVYVAYPKNDSSIEFYVLDELTGGGFGIWQYYEPHRELSDTYIYALLEDNFVRISEIYSNINLEYNSKTDLSVSNISMASYSQTIKIQISEYNEINSIAKAIVDISAFVNDKIKYKNKNITIEIVHPEYSYVDSYELSKMSNLKLDGITEQLTEHFIDKLRANGDIGIYDIPINVKEKYAIKCNFEYPNKFYQLPNVYINEQILTANVYFEYRDGEYLIRDGIQNLLPFVAKKFKAVDPTQFGGIENLKSPIIYSYEKDGNIYVFTYDEMEGVNIYTLINSKLELVKELVNFPYITIEELDKYLGITYSYDYEKEALNLKY